jgi:hypothetical protein
VEDVWGPEALALLKERGKARQRKPGLGLPNLENYLNELSPLRKSARPSLRQR